MAYKFNPFTGTLDQAGVDGATGTVSAAGSGTAAAPGIAFASDPNTGIFNPAADTLAFAEGGTEAARIDSSGRLLVGTSSARANFYNSTISAQFQVEGSSITDRIISLISSSSTGSSGPVFISGKQSSGAVGGNTVVASADNLGNISFQGNDGTEFVEAASISAFVDGTPGANDMPGRLVLSTTADGAASPTERMRIDNAGRVLVGTTTANTSGAKLQTVDGLTFPATAVASADPNTLDDYEEGSWTPVVVGTTTAGTVTYSGLVGSYTKIGNVVNFLLYCGWNSGTGTGNLEVTGLPFAANTSNGRFYPGSVYANNLTIPIGNTLNVLITSTKLVLTSTPTGGGAGTAVVYDASVVELVVQGTYFIS